MMLEVRQLRLAYGSRILAPDVSFHLEGGECVLLAGANGCGKSTLLNVLAGEGIISQTASASLRPLPKPAYAVFGPLPLIWPRVAIGFRNNTLYL